MWLLKDTPAFLMDLYELTMAQAYFKNNMDDRAYFEVTVRNLPADWGFFVMAGLAEVDAYLKEFAFWQRDLEYLKSTELFSGDFLEYLSDLKLHLDIRSLAEGTVFFTDEPVFEVGGPLIHAQILESYILNILGFSIIEATLAARISIAAGPAALVDFGLRRSQGPVAAVRAARAAQMAGFAATSNLFAARLLDLESAGTMAHSFIQAHESEELAFHRFIELYGEKAILLVDTYDTVEGIKTAAKVAKQAYNDTGVKIKGIRIDSGDFAALSKFARRHFENRNVTFMKIFVSSGLDEYRIAELVDSGAEIDGFGIGTRFAVSHHAPDIDIVYKIIQYAGKGLYKTSPDKHSRPERKTVLRTKDMLYVKDTVVPYAARADDLLKPFEAPEPIETVKNRLRAELDCLPDEIKTIRNPKAYPVEYSAAI